MRLILLTLALLLALVMPVAALPVVEEFWIMTYCSLNPSSTSACRDQGIRTLLWTVQVEHVLGQQIYELSDAQLLTLGLPLPSTGILFDYVSFGGNYLYSNDRDFWDGVPLPFVALKPFSPHLVNTEDIAPAPEPATLLLLGTTLAGVGYVARKRRGLP